MMILWGKTGRERVEISWLTRVNSWIDEGLRLNAVGDDVKIKNAGTEIGLIRNNTLLATNYSSGFSGTPVGDAVNGCRIFKNGSQIFVKRVPDISGLDQLEVQLLMYNERAHTLEKHGFDVSHEALRLRAKNGIAPNGQHVGNNPPPYPTQHGTKFNNIQSLRIALFEIGPESAAFHDAISALPQNQSTFAIEHTFQSAMGYGYRKDSVVFESNIQKVIAAYRRDETTGNYYLITMYPEID